ncbi:MAG: glycine cleavage system protein GcvH [Candidatus Omnitrophica bacterium]|nr:glycine cleavage system protein GcvH [Candidatus Omnitrophota bacterium]
MADPRQLRYTKTHEWIRPDGKKAVVGITQHAQEEISDVVFVELPKLGRAVRQGDEVAVVESVKAAFSIYAPASGTVSQVNEALAKDPGAINRSPYDDGWIFVLEPVDPKEADGLLSHDQYEEWVKGGH